MSLKSTLLAIFIVMALLLPAGQLLRDQNPWSCFNFTLDEAFFAQAAQHWAEGKGYRMANSLPFDPTITVGVPLAWGASAVSSVSGEDIANSGRLFVYGCFILLLLAVGRFAYVRGERNWFAVPCALGIFGYGLSRIPFGGYFVFGFLGETPGFLAAALAYGALEQRRFFRAGIYAVLAFALKPTFLLFLPAVWLTGLLHSGRAAFRSGLAISIGTFGLFYAYARARNQPIAEYLELYFRESRRISNDVPSGTLFDFYAGFEPALAWISFAFLFLGAYAVFRARKHASATIAAFFVFIISILYFLISGHRPVEKQWGAIMGITLVGFSIHWGAIIANPVRGGVPREFARGIVVAVLLTWIFAVGPVARHRYLRLSETACASKEQSAINARLRVLFDHGDLTRDNLGAWIVHHQYDETLFRLPFEPTYRKDWKDFGPTLPKWLYGETALLFPSPEGCVPEFKGDSFALLKCERKIEVTPSVEPRSRGRGTPKKSSRG
ncbi:MAG: hypothetical protein JST04_13005 [Bdellovibrionales bacterium]|nr:hypothetical protein [Bdellovibrionales bacterium]